MFVCFFCFFFVLFLRGFVFTMEIRASARMSLFVRFGASRARQLNIRASIETNNETTRFSQEEQMAGKEVAKRLDDPRPPGCWETHNCCVFWPPMTQIDIGRHFADCD